MTPWAQLEDVRYSWRWANGYGAAQPFESMDLAGVSRWDSVVDLGCGNAKLRSYFFWDYAGVDVSASLIADLRKLNWRYTEFYHASLDDLSCLAGQSFDVAACNDTLEHTPPEHVDAVLAAIAGVEAKLFVFNICCRDSSARGPNGETLHPTVRPPAWWLDKLRERFAVEVLKEEPTRLICKGTKICTTA